MTISILPLQNRSLMALEKQHGMKWHSEVCRVLKAKLLPPARLLSHLVFSRCFQMSCHFPVPIALCGTYVLCLSIRGIQKTNTQKEEMTQSSMVESEPAFMSVFVSL